MLPPVAFPLVVGVDQCIEQLHFSQDTSRRYRGRASVVLRDLAASPPVDLVATACPASMSHREALLLCEAIEEEAQRLECPLVE